MPGGAGRHGGAGSGHAAVAATRSVEAEAVGHAAVREPVNGVPVGAPADEPSTTPPLDAPPLDATAEAFDALYTATASRLTWQTYLLTANQHRAAHCVRRTFQMAWTNWPAVSADTSPEGWLRATAFELALSPWHRGGPRMQHLVQLPHRRLKGATADEADLPLTDQDRALLKALLRLPRPQRRALVLHDVVGLDWTQTAAEVEGSTPVVSGRVARARRSLAASVPGIVGGDPEVPGFGRRLGEQLRATAVRACGDAPLHAPARVTRARARLHDGGLTVAAGALTVATAGFIGAGLVWGTPMHPAEKPVIRHPVTATVIGVADTRPSAIQPSLLPATQLTPYATGNGLIPDTPGSDAKRPRHSGSGSGSAGDSGAGDSGAGGRDGGRSHTSESHRHGHPHQPPAKKHH